MIRLNEIETTFLSLVGWEQGFGPSVLDSRLLGSESGLTYQAAHPLITLENIRSIMPEDFSATAWDADVLYSPGAAVISGGKVYIALEASQGVMPGDGDKWMDALSWYVRKLTLDGIRSAVMSFIQQKQLNRETRSLVERRTFFDGAARLQATIRPTGKLVGMEIVPVRAMGVTTKLERIGLQMIGGAGEVTLYLFHSSQVEPVKVIRLEYTNTKGGFQWFALDDVYLPYMGGDTDAGGAWYLVYNQNDLPEGMRALNVSKDWSSEPCQTCLGGSIEGWKQITKYMQVSPCCIKAPVTFAEYPEMFDVGKLAYTNTMNYGINAEVTVGCDLTDFIIEQRMMFAQVLQRQVATNVLRTLAMNPDVRVNRNQLNVTREGILYELEGDTRGRASGLVYELQQAYKALSLDTRGLDRICLQCTNNGVKYRTV